MSRMSEFHLLRQELRARRGLRAPRPVPNLSIALSILMRAECREVFLHADVSAFGAPSECHDDVDRGMAKRMRVARKHAEAVSQRPLRCILRAAARSGVDWGRVCNRVYWNNYPF